MTERSGQFVSVAEAERMVRDALARERDEEVVRVADQDGQRLAILESEVRHVRDAQKEASATAKEERAMMQREIALMRADVQALKDVLTKASGMKLAFMLFIGGLGFILSQFWNFWGSR